MFPEGLCAEVSSAPCKPRRHTRPRQFLQRGGTRPPKVLHRNGLSRNRGVDDHNHCTCNFVFHSEARPFLMVP